MIVRTRGSWGRASKAWGTTVRVVMGARAMVPRRSMGTAKSSGAMMMSSRDMSGGTAECAWGTASGRVMVAERAVKWTMHVVDS